GFSSSDGFSSLSSDGLLSDPSPASSPLLSSTFVPSSFGGTDSSSGADASISSESCSSSSYSFFCASISAFKLRAVSRSPFSTASYALEIRLAISFLRSSKLAMQYHSLLNLCIKNSLTFQNEGFLCLARFSFVPTV